MKLPDRSRSNARAIGRVRAAGIWLAALTLLAAVGPVAADDAPPVAATFAQEVARTHLPVAEAYHSQRPRLLFGSDDRATLQAKAQAQPELWAPVLRAGRGLGDVPGPDAIAAGSHYWRIERVESAALAWFVTGERRHLDAAARWMVAHCKAPIWGNAYRPNVDLQASWYLYHIAIAYDILHDELTEADRTAIRDGLIDHARAIHDSFEPGPDTRWSFDQNHTYIPATALATAALALLDETPEAQAWLNRACAMMNRSRYALGTDGYYYEGPGYWSYALHWHVRYAELLARATGEPAMDLPILRQNHLYARHMSLPGSPNFFDLGDTGQWSEERTALEPTNHAMLWAVASHLRSGEIQAVADDLMQRYPEKVYHAAAFLWYDPAVKPGDLADMPPYHYFKDHGVVAWRSGWGEDATVYLFRCGPSQGHAAAAKLAQMKDWRMNSGHVHPDIGAFWMYARGQYLLSDTGYVTEKRAQDHNTLLVGGQGQGQDGSYWYERHWPYEAFDQARIERIHLEDAYGYVRGRFGSVYPPALGKLDVQRSLVMTRDWLLVVDELEAPEPQTLTWLAHSIGAFSKEGRGHVLHLGDASLTILPLTDTPAQATVEPAVVMAGSKPGGGEPTKRGHRLRVTTAPQRTVRLVHLLLPTGPAEAPPQAELLPAPADAVHLQLTWPDGRTQQVRLDPGAEAPVHIQR